MSVLEMTEVNQRQDELAAAVLFIGYGIDVINTPGYQFPEIIDESCRDALGVGQQVDVADLPDSSRNELFELKRGVRDIVYARRLENRQFVDHALSVVERINAQPTMETLVGFCAFRGFSD